MVNPSTADAEIDDATIRRVIGFGKRFGWSQVVVGNVFAFRATDIGELALVEDPVGPENSAHLNAIIDQVDIIVVAWGTLAKLPGPLRNEWRNFAELAESAGKCLQCLGRTADGQPRHPLMLSYESALVGWQAP